MKIDDRLLNLTKELKSVLSEHQKQAKNQLASMPEGDKKEQLKNILKQASSGNTSLEDIQAQLKNVLANGG